MSTIDVQEFHLRIRSEETGARPRLRARSLEKKLDSYVKLMSVNSASGYGAKRRAHDPDYEHAPLKKNSIPIVACKCSQIGLGQGF
jgi:hypothetical protein